MSSEDGSFAEKLIVIGEHSIGNLKSSGLIKLGKTCLVRRFCEGTFTEGYKVK
jgi:hypothetical protein